MGKKRVKKCNRIRFSAHIENGHRLGFEKQNSEEHAVFSGAPSGRSLEAAGSRG